MVSMFYNAQQILTAQQVLQPPSPVQITQFLLLALVLSQIAQPNLVTMDRQEHYLPFAHLEAIVLEVITYLFVQQKVFQI